MTGRRREDEDEENVGKVAAAYATLGPAAAGIVGLSGLLGEGERPREHDPAPIGSDPWLTREVRAALARGGVRDVTFVVKDAVVTVTGSEGRMLDVDRAVRTVAGVKDVRFDP